MHSNTLASGPDGRPRLPALLLVTAVAVTAAHNQAWGSALATAAAVYSVIANGSGIGGK